MMERPGEYPFTRGIHPRMYADRLWTMRQYAGYGHARETNRRYRYLLERGQTGLSVAFDLPTQMGYDPDHAMARGEVGRAGVSIACLDDMKALFDGIPFDRVSVSMTINATAATLVALYAAAAASAGVARPGLRGTVQNDVLKEFVARGCYIYPPEPSLRLATDLAEFCVREMPEWNYISVSGYHIREAGATASQEVGFTLANGIEYVKRAVERGLGADDVGRRVSFFFSADRNFLEEIGKFRAARRLWARILKERFGAKDPRAMALRFHAQTAGSTLTAQQPKNNLVRVTLQALAAVLGGTQSLHANAMDEALGLPTEAAAKLALRTQQILAHETGIADVADPFGGSEAVERETSRIEGEAEAYLREVDARGGAVPAILQRYYQKEIEKSAYDQQREVESEKRIVVGVNKYGAAEEEKPVEVLKVDERFEEEQRREVGEARRRRDAAGASEARRALASAARGTENLVPRILECVKAGVTLGEVSATLEDAFGRYEPR